MYIETRRNTGGRTSIKSKEMKDHRHVEPTKFHPFMEKMKEVLEDKRTVILTDRELWVLVNQQLDPKQRVSYSAFEKWKSPTSHKNVEGNRQISDEEAADFRQALEYARVTQKMNLTGNVMDEGNKNQWGSTWILERKFEDLKKQPMIALNSNPTIQISAGDAEAQRMIDQMINGEVIDIDHEEEGNKQIEE